MLLSTCFHPALAFNAKHIPPTRPRAVLDVASGSVAHTLAGHSGGTNGLRFLSGNSLVSVGEDGCARLWNVVRASCLHELKVDAEGADRWAGGVGGWEGGGPTAAAGRCAAQISLLLPAPKCHTHNYFPQFGSPQREKF